MIAAPLVVFFAPWQRLGKGQRVQQKSKLQVGCSAYTAHLMVQAMQAEARPGCA